MLTSYIVINWSSAKREITKLETAAFNLYETFEREHLFIILCRVLIVHCALSVGCFFFIR